MESDRLYKIIKEIRDIKKCSKEKAFEMMLDYIAYKIGISGSVFIIDKNMYNTMTKIDINKLSNSINSLKTLYLDLFYAYTVEDDINGIELDGQAKCYFFRNIGLSFSAIQLRDVNDNAIIFGFNNNIIDYKLNLIVNKVLDLNIYYVFTNDINETSLKACIGRANKWV